MSFWKHYQCTGNLRAEVPENLRVHSIVQVWHPAVGCGACPICVQQQSIACICHTLRKTAHRGECILDVFLARWHPSCSRGLLHGIPSVASVGLCFQIPVTEFWNTNIIMGTQSWPAHHEILKYYQSASKAHVEVLENLLVRPFCHICCWDRPQHVMVAKSQ